MSDYVQAEKPAIKRLRGFAAMSVERQRAIASAGGKAAHESGNAHEFDTTAAREAGRKGGYKVSENREHMAAIGRKGGRVGGGRRIKGEHAMLAANGNGGNGAEMHASSASEDIMGGSESISYSV